MTEINSTFYRIPDTAMVQKWNTDTPKHFRFTAKFPSIITHEKRLENVSSEIFSFLSSLIPIHEKIYALVLQLPPSLSFEEAKPRLDKIFEILPDNFLYPIEGRHPSWFSKDSLSYLKQKSHCLVWSDIDGIDNPMSITSDYLYIRLIGDRSIPDSKFGRVIKNKDSSLSQLVKKLSEIENIPVATIMTNNHYEGFSPATANSLRTKLGMRELIWEEKKQKTLNSF